MKMRIPTRPTELLFWILFGAFICDSHRVKGCDAGTACILLSECPHVRQSTKTICGIETTTDMVCCTSDLTSNPAIEVRANDNESLLPTLCGRPFDVDKIVGGTPAPYGAYPWMAALYYTDVPEAKATFGCAGSILNSRYILTAAHCVHPSKLGTKKLSFIHVGDWNLTSDLDCQESRFGRKCFAPHLVVGSEDVTWHPQYNLRAKSSDDIALVRLNVTLDFQNEKASVEPACLATKDMELPLGIQPIATGWGSMENGTHSDVLLRVKIPIKSDSLCKARYQSRYVGNQLCAGGEGGFDTCSGDSGGPLVISTNEGPPFTQIGLVSFGPKECGTDKFPAVYTSVGAYREWIIDNLKP